MSALDELIAKSTVACSDPYHNSNGDLGEYIEKLLAIVKCMREGLESAHRAVHQKPTIDKTLTECERLAGEK